jgi:hypothetical protein
MQQIRPKRTFGQSWKIFMRNHTAEVSGVWACDFLQVTDLFFRPLIAFFLFELKSRRVIQHIRKPACAGGWSGNGLFSRGVAPQVSSGLKGLTVVFGMGTSVSPSL